LAEDYANGRLDETRRVTAEVLLLDLYEEELDKEKEYISTPVSDVVALIGAAVIQAAMR
jgi:hypothetical protein